MTHTGGKERLRHTEAIDILFFGIIKLAIMTPLR
jgi:hypothetical protein